MKTKSASSYHHGNLEKAIIDLGITSAKEQGLAGLGVRKLANAAGVSPGAIYKHFPNSEVIKAEVSKAAREALAKKMLSDAENISDARLRFQSLIASYLDFAFTQKNLFAVASASCSEPPKTPDEYSVWAIVIYAIEALDKEGILRTGTVATNADFVWASAQGFATLVNLNENLVELTRDGFIRHITSAVIA